MNNLAPLFPIFLILAVFAVIGVIGYFSWRAEKARVAALRVVANDLGFDFAPNGPAALQSDLATFHLFSQGHAKQFTNVMTGRTAHLDVIIFDYRYTTGHGKNARTWNTTVIRFRADGLDLPKFVLRPESFWHRVGSAIFGYQDIDFDTHPKFSKAFLLKGSNEVAVRHAFTPEVLEHFETIPGVSAEADGDTLLFYRHNARTAPDKVRDLLAEGFAVHALFHPTEPPPPPTDTPQ